MADLTPTQSRLAVVSGGGTGIGRAVAAALMADGNDVLVTGRRAGVLAATVDELNAAATGPATTAWVAADLAEPADVRAVVRAVQERGGRVDVVVANAGSPSPRAEGELEQVAAAWEAAFRANVLTSVLLIQGLEPMLARPGGRIVMISSASALTGSASPAYGAAKAALHGWVLHLAAQLGPDGITANVIAPGFTDGTELVAGRIPPERRARLLARIAAGRPAEPAEIAAVVRSFAAADASYLNGQVVAVDGGTLPT